MAQVSLVQLPIQVGGISQVTVVSKGQTVRRVYVEWLGKCGAGAARRRVSHVTNTHLACQSAHVASPEDILNQTIVFS